ncbi:lysin B [Mycobacterium phage DrLupo]|uniref:Lysin B n=1 Tax=Mycobacterium phage DrLupo TaxID=2499037 RepID=A0A3S9UQK5_9CAUD|nr:lysin B [Mycobacterium phage DrLupo]AZS12578.1 lysin B [Mycobacterium phage DrLupo]
MTAPLEVVANQVSEGWHPAREVGDIDPLISDAKLYLKRFSYGQAEGLGTVDTDDTYTEGFGRALVKFKEATKILVELGRVAGPATDTDTEFDWATKKQMQLLSDQSPTPTTPPGSKLPPLYITVEGHESDMWIGPAVEVGKRLEKEGLVQLQPTFYNNKGIPFKSDTGVAEICRFFLDPVKMPEGRKFFLSGFSEGDIVVSRFLLRHVLNPKGQFHHRLKDWIGCLEYGAPYRPLDYMGPVLLVSDPPKPNTSGISPERLPILNNVAYVCRTKDIYTENENNSVGKKKSAIYEVVANSNPAAVFWELLAVGIRPTTEVLAIAAAIGSGLLFVANMDPHGGYVLEPGQNWARGMIKAAIAA